jgi:SAM-dependent methyltransferase
MTDSLGFHRTRYAKPFAFDEQRWARIRPCLNWVRAEQERLGRRLTVLDVGCGDGMVSRLFLETGCRALGVDLVPEFAQQAAEKGIETKTADVTRDGLPFSEGEIDVVYAGALIEHLYDPEFFLRECYRVLTDAGLLLLSTPNIASLTSRLRMLLGRGPKFYTSALSWEFGGHIRIFTAGTLKRLLEESGFAVEEVVADLVSFIPARKSRKPWSMRLGKRLPSLGEVLIVKARKGPQRGS